MADFLETISGLARQLQLVPLEHRPQVLQRGMTRPEGELSALEMFLRIEEIGIGQGAEHHAVKQFAGPLAVLFGTLERRKRVRQVRGGREG